MSFFKFGEKIYLFFQRFFSFLAGSVSCIGCGTKCLALPLCKNCQLFLKNFVPFSKEKALKFGLPLRCSQCGKILLSETELCSECRELKQKRKTIRYFPIHSYRLWKKDLMYFWKTENHRSLSFFFADLIYNAINSLLKDEKMKFDCLVPVPPRPGKIKKKGWDQIDELCKILRLKYGFRIEYPLVRNSFIEQKKLAKEERQARKKQEYGIKPNYLINFKKVLIIDDVITTGSTMEKCAEILYSCGIKEVYGMSLFIVN